MANGLTNLAGGVRGEVWGFLRDTLTLFRQNARQVILFVLASSVLSLMATLALTHSVTRLLMMFAHTTHISPANLFEVALNPACVVTLIVEQVLAALIALFQIAGLLHAFSMAQVGLPTNLWSMVAAGSRCAVKALHPRNWLVVPFLLVLLPLTGVFSVANTTYKVILPGFVNQTIEYTAELRIAYAIVYAILLSVTLIYVLSINVFVLRDDSFTKACGVGKRLGQGRYLRTLLCLGTIMLIVYVTINTVSSALVVNLSELVMFFRPETRGFVGSSQIGINTYVLRTLLISLIVPVANNAALTALFYRYLDEEDELFGTLSRKTFKSASAPRNIGYVAVVAAALLIAFFTRIAREHAFLAEPVDRPLVCAHRGDNTNAPENTMPAFELAFHENLPWIELDVHQTADGYIVCSHDSDIGRVTGHALKISTSTLNELRRYEMGSWMPGDYEHVVIPTLEEVLTAAKEYGVKVQVELKGDPSDVRFEENVLDVINRCDMHDQVMVISQDASRLIRMAEIDPTITKGYCMFYARGNVEDIAYTDNVTIEENNITPELVHRLHEKGMLVFCWTVDRDDTVQYLVSCEVDVIGTDNPLLINAALERADYSGGFARVLAIFLDMFARMAA